MIFARRLAISGNQRKSARRCFSKIEDEVFSSERRDDSINLEKDRVYSIKHTNILEGHANSHGTFYYSQRNSDKVPPSNFNVAETAQGPLHLSKLGLGTYLGDPGTLHDKLVFDSIIASCLSGGVNVLDTSSNYRYMKAERTLGAAVAELVKSHGINRSELFIATKGGYLTVIHLSLESNWQEDGDREPGYYKKQIDSLVDKGRISSEDIVAETHCMHPNFLEFSLRSSLDNMKLQCVDLYYIHNSAESQLALLGEDKYYTRLAKAFEFLEEKCEQGSIKNYGMATFNCFRSPPEEEGIHLSLQKVHNLAEKVGGKDHRLKFIQLPINAVAFEAVFEEWQFLTCDLVYQDFE